MELTVYVTQEKTDKRITTYVNGRSDCRCMMGNWENGLITGKYESSSESHDERHIFNLTGEFKHILNNTT